MKFCDVYYELSKVLKYKPISFVNYNSQVMWYLTSKSKLDEYSILLNFFYRITSYDYLATKKAVISLTVYNHVTKVWIRNQTLNT